MPEIKQPYKQFSENIRYDINVAEMTGYLNHQRKVVLAGEITEKKMHDLTMMLLQLDYEKTEPITILIDSSGGDVAASYFFQDMINSLNSPVDGLVIGDAYSMAVDVLQMCRVRKTLPNARIGCHFTRHGFNVIAYSETFGENHLQAIKTKVLKNKAKREAMYVARTGQSIEQIREIFEAGGRYKHYMTAHEALEKGFVDEILTNFKFFQRKPAVE